MSPLRLDGVRAVVTGASRGLGRVVAEGYVREGATVVATARTLAHLDGLGRACEGAPGTLIRAVALELAEPASVAAAAAACRAALGRIDVVVNNAGILGVRLPLLETPPEALAEAFAVNVAGPLGLVGGLADALADGAVIINVSSGAAGRSGWGAYGLTKAALNVMTQMLGQELAGRGVRCVAINPGPLRTDMRRTAYPAEDPATVPHARSVVGPFVAIAAGAEAEGFVEAREWTQ
jgi:NAD(P)-dependent dehydrogenase (short-subunit alcohol dehydrogenase family)